MRIHVIDHGVVGSYLISDVSLGTLQLFLVTGCGSEFKCWMLSGNDLPTNADTWIWLSLIFPGKTNSTVVSPLPAN